MAGLRSPVPNLHKLARAFAALQSLRLHYGERCMPQIAAAGRWPSENRQPAAIDVRKSRDFGAAAAHLAAMDMDFEACRRAFLTRDPRFDGRIFGAVRTTGIYCRPICPARTPKAQNMTF